MRAVPALLSSAALASRATLSPGDEDEDEDDDGHENDEDDEDDKDDDDAAADVMMIR